MPSDDVQHMIWSTGHDTPHVETRHTQYRTGNSRCVRYSSSLIIRLFLLIERKTYRELLLITPLFLFQYCFTLPLLLSYSLSLPLYLTFTLSLLRHLLPSQYFNWSSSYMGSFFDPQVQLQLQLQLQLKSSLRWVTSIYVTIINLVPLI